jgi:hypothetical protein
MALTRTNRWLALWAAMAAIALIWSGSISARTQFFGDERASFQALPEADGEMCLFPSPAALQEEPKPPSIGEWAAAETQRFSADRMVQPFAGAGADICEVSAFAGAAGSAAQAQQRRPLPPYVGERAAEGIPREIHARQAVINRPPVRYLKDPYAAFSSISVNAENDMVIMTDENLFRIVEYSRRDNTPPNAPLTEPRRAIGGDQTRT